MEVTSTAKWNQRADLARRDGETCAFVAWSQTQVWTVPGGPRPAASGSWVGGRGGRRGAAGGSPRQVSDWIKRPV